MQTTLPVPLPILAPISPPCVIESFWFRNGEWRPYGYGQHDKMGTCRAKIASFIEWFVTDARGNRWEYKKHKDERHSADFKIRPSHLNMGDILVVRTSSWNAVHQKYETVDEYAFYP